VVDADPNCGSVVHSNVTFKIEKDATSRTCTPNPATNYLNGSYNCTWDSSFETLGYWNVTIEAPTDFYNNTDYYVKENALQIRERPQLTIPQIDSIIEGWGYNYSFNVTLVDPDYQDTVNVTLWRSFDQSTWEVIDYRDCFDCRGETVVKFVSSVV
jgi:hypothetical protein